MAPKAPPAALLRAVNAVRGVLRRLHARTAPANLAVLEMTMGSWLTQAI